MGMQDSEFEKIYKIIKQILFEDEFKNNQLNYIIDHSERFKEEDFKNKDDIPHELHSCHQEYIKKFDTIFTDELNKRCGNVDLKLFTNKLLEKIEKNELKDQDILDTLYSFTDFKVFFKIMLDNKKQTMNTEKNMNFDIPTFEKLYH